MSFLESLLTGIAEARRHPGQTAASLVGLVLGTASIVAVLSLFGGQARQTQEFIREVGGAATIIARDAELPARPTARELASPRLTYGDAAHLKRRATALSAVAPGWARQLSWRAGDVDFVGQVIGTVPDYARINDIRTTAGRFLTELDVHRSSPVAVLGWAWADSLFGDAEAAVGRPVEIGRERYRVVGVMEREEFYFAPWAGNSLAYRNRRGYVPITTAFARYTGSDVRLDFLTLRAARDAGLPAARTQVAGMLYLRHGVEDFRLTAPGGGSGGQESQFFLLFNLIFLVVGAVSLFTGGVVIANIFLASVVEGVRELGTRMALGATAPHIFGHVLAQVGAVSLVGGLLGLGVGSALVEVVAALMSQPAHVTPAIAAVAVGTAVGVGLLAGSYPAFRAARLSPVEALRYG